MLCAVLAVQLSSNGFCQVPRHLQHHHPHHHRHHSPSFFAPPSPLLQVPETAYEVNFVLTDGEQLFDNNAGQDYAYPVTAGITWEEWQAAAIERQEEQERERQKAEEVRGVGWLCCVGVRCLVVC